MRFIKMELYEAFIPSNETSITCPYVNCKKESCNLFRICKNHIRMSTSYEIYKRKKFRII